MGVSTSAFIALDGKHLDTIELFKAIEEHFLEKFRDLNEMQKVNRLVLRSSSAPHKFGKITLNSGCDSVYVTFRQDGKDRAMFMCLDIESDYSQYAKGRKITMTLGHNEQAVEIIHALARDISHKLGFRVFFNECDTSAEYVMVEQKPLEVIMKTEYDAVETLGE